MSREVFTCENAEAIFNIALSITKTKSTRVILRYTVINLTNVLKIEVLTNWLIVTEKWKKTIDVACSFGNFWNVIEKVMKVLSRRLISISDRIYLKVRKNSLGDISEDYFLFLVFSRNDWEAVFKKELQQKFKVFQIKLSKEIKPKNNLASW